MLEVDRGICILMHTDELGFLLRRDDCGKGHIIMSFLLSVGVTRFIEQVCRQGMKAGVKITLLWLQTQ